MTTPCAPTLNCQACPRLVAFRDSNRSEYPDWHNGPVPSFGPLDAQLLIVGLAPGLRGANQTGRPFTGDYAGDLLYPTLKKYGFAQGDYQRHPGDGFTLINTRVTNAVRCVPPENKPTAAEISTCRQFLKAEMVELSSVNVIVVLGRIAHESVVRTLERSPSKYPFGHNSVHSLTPNLTLIDSYHCSRYNTNTGRLTETMFHDVFDTVSTLLKKK